MLQKLSKALKRKYTIPMKMARNANSRVANAKPMKPSARRDIRRLQ